MIYVTFGSATTQYRAYPIPGVGPAGWAYQLVAEDGGTAMTEERKVEVTVEDKPVEPEPKIEVNIEAPKKDKEDDE